MSEQIDNSLKEINRKFDVIDKSTEKSDFKIDKINEDIYKLTLKIEKLTHSQEVSIRDYFIENNRYYENKFNTLRMYIFVMMLIIVSLVLKMAGIITL